MKGKKPIHAIFHCSECNAYFDDNKTAERKAREHSRKTCHYIHGEITYMAWYGVPK